MENGSTSTGDPFVPGKFPMERSFQQYRSNWKTWLNGKHPSFMSCLDLCSLLFRNKDKLSLPQVEVFCSSLYLHFFLLGILASISRLFHLVLPIALISLPGALNASYFLFIFNSSRSLSVFLLHKCVQS